MTTQTVSEWAAMARLVRRTGFGATGAEVDAAVALGRDAYLRSVLAGGAVDPGVTATPPPDLPAVPPAARSAGVDAARKRRQQVNGQLRALTAWWVGRMVTAQHPGVEKLTFGWHDHFATSAVKVKKPAAMLAQNEKLRAQGRGDFGTLAYGMLTDAATVYWLDGEANTAAAPNENLSREFMELFALGHGNGYTETDVREGARALTGWRIAADGTTAQVAAKHDSGSKTVLGVTGNLDARSFCAAVLAPPAAGTYLITRWYGRLVSDQPPAPQVVAAIAAAYGPGRDLTAMFTAMLGSDDFVARIGSQIISPVEWLVGALRALKVPLTGADGAKTAAQLQQVLTGLGQVPFHPPSVGGWPTGQAWLTTSAAELRMRTAATLTRHADLSAVASAAPSSRLETVAHLLGIAGWTDRSRTALTASLSEPAQLVAVALNTPEYLAH